MENLPRLKVRNFGPIKEADLAVNRFTVIIGKQASGKSTLAKLLYFFYELPEILRVYYTDKDQIVISKEELEKRIITQFESYFGSLNRKKTDVFISFGTKTAFSVWNEAIFYIVLPKQIKKLRQTINAWEVAFERNKSLHR